MVVENGLWMRAVFENGKENDVDIFLNEEVSNRVREGLRVGKNPWCCSMYIEDRAYAILNAGGVYPQETYMESQRRWCEEGVITKNQLKEIERELKEQKEKTLVSNVRSALDNLIAYYQGEPSEKSREEN